MVWTAPFRNDTSSSWSEQSHSALASAILLSNGAGMIWRAAFHPITSSGRLPEPHCTPSEPQSAHHRAGRTAMISFQLEIDPGTALEPSAASESACSDRRRLLPFQTGACQTGGGRIHGGWPALSSPSRPWRAGRSPFSARLIRFRPAPCSRRRLGLRTAKVGAFLSSQFPLC